MWEVIAIMVVVGAVLYGLGRRDSTTDGQPSRTQRAPAAPQTATRSPSRTRPRREQAPAAPARERMPFASDGMHGEMFSYAGGAAAGSEHVGPYAVIDVETTGLSPGRGDRVIEVAMARVTADGRVEDEFATLINPEGRDTGPAFIHGISNDDVAKAPIFAEIVPEVLARLDGAVVVAHNAPFEERFLAAELARAGHRGLRMPALCTLWLGRRTFRTPNHKLATLARDAGVPLVDKHAALGDVRAVAALLPVMLERHGGGLRYGCSTYAHGADLSAGRPQLVTRAVALRKGTDGWMHSLMSRLPMTANDVDDAAAEVYLDALAEVLADGKIIGEEAAMLAQLAGQAGMGGEQVRALNERFLEAMREAALADQVLTSQELRDLNAAAKALGAPDYFDDLRVSRTAVSQGGASEVAAPTGARRCGHCRTPGHYRSTCPELA